MRTPYHVWSARLGVIWVALAVGVGLAGRAVPASGDGKPDTTADVNLTRFHLVETKEGATLWEVWGDRGEVFEKAGLARVTKISKRVTVMLYSAQGKLTARSDGATLNMRTKDIRLEGNVTATSEQGNSLQTQSLDWLAKDRRLFTRSAVTLIRGGLVSSGVGLEAETDLERARLLSRVRSHVAPGSVELKAKAPSSVRNGGSQ